MITDLKKILALFHQPYPFYYYKKRLIKSSVIVAIVITSILYILKPFDTDFSEFRYNYFVTCIIYGLVTGVSIYLTVQILVLIFPGFFKEEKWSLAKELVILTIILILIGNANFFIRNLINTNPDNFKIGYYFEELSHAFLVGIFPIVFITLLNYSYLFKTNNTSAGATNAILSRKHDYNYTEKPHSVTILSQSAYETVSLSIPELCFIKSDGNYIEIYQNTNGKIHRHIIRNTLSHIEKQLSDYDNIIKTHRSFLVNIDHIDTVRGNAQGYSLQMKDCSIKVPVSRNNISRFNVSVKNSIA